MRPQVLALTEYQTTTLPREALDERVAMQLWRGYAPQVSVEPPTFLNGYQWRLTPKGYVGQIPLTPELHLVLQPRVPIANLFRMLEYAYRLGRFDTGLAAAESLQEVYENLAIVLSRRVLDRARRGLYRAYLPREECATLVRGRMNLARLSRVPWDPRVRCHYREHSADLEDNRILAWTLFSIARSGVCGEERLPVVRQAFRQLQHSITLAPLQARECLGRSYHRLNEDYQALHALCHFFLDTAGPTHTYGEHTMVPFLIDMARLFEAFVANWLAAHLPVRYHAVAQQRERLDESGALSFYIDLVLLDREAGRAVCVMDTKYKTAEAAPDLHEAIAYAQTVGCQEAWLIYPAPLGHPFEARARDITVRDLTFDLSDDLEVAGERLMAQLVRHSETAARVD